MSPLDIEKTRGSNLYLQLYQNIEREIINGSLRPGDIVVFKIPRSGYHTGIYIGQNNFIHSPKPRARVRIESLSVNYWNRYYVTARRVARR